MIKTCRRWLYQDPEGPAPSITPLHRCNCCRRAWSPALTGECSLSMGSVAGARKTVPAITPAIEPKTLPMAAALAPVTVVCRNSPICNGHRDPASM